MTRTLALAAISAFAFCGVAAAQTPEQATPAQATPAQATPDQASPSAPVTFTTTCPGTLPTPPAFPDGATANARQMDTGNTEVQAWSSAYLAVMNCRVAEVNGIEAELAALLARRNAAKALYDTDAATYRTTGEAWAAEVEEFNTRFPPRRGRGN